MNNVTIIISLDVFPRIFIKKLHIYSEVLLNGYASDGGMFLPMTIPKISEATLEEWSSLGYIQIVKKICSLFIEDEMTSQEINGQSYTTLSVKLHNTS